MLTGTSQVNFLKYSIVHIICYTYFYKTLLWTWEYASGVNQRTQVQYQHPQGSSYQSMVPVPGHSTLSEESWYEGGALTHIR